MPDLRRKGILIGTVAMLALLALLTSPMSGQSFYGSIVGTVTDVSGAAVPGATVTVTNTGTNEMHAMKSDVTGGFGFANMVPATYKLEIQAANFKRFVRQPIQVQVGMTVRIDAPLSVGDTTETIEVTTQSPLLQTESGQMSQQVEGAIVQEMPLNGRNPMNLIALTAGVVPQGGSLGVAGGNQNTGNTTNIGWGNYQIGGGISGQSAAYLDGVALNMVGNTMSLVPTQDIVQEISVASNAVSADFGRFAGGVVNMTTKSGNNQWHGAVYEYFRNTILNGNNWFNKQNQVITGQPNIPPKFNQNQFGGSASGPVLRDRVFFMFAWEKVFLRQGLPSPTFVPTTTMKSGKVPVTTGILVKDPAKKCTLAAPADGLLQKTADGQYWDLVASGCAISKAALEFMNYYPDTNTGTSTAYYRNVNIGPDSAQYSGRVDYNLSEKQRIFGRYTFWNIADINFNEFPDAKYNLGNGAVKNKTYMVVLGDTYTFNPTTILDARLSWTRQQYNTDLPVTNADETKFFPGASFTSQIPVHLLPLFTLANQRGIYTNWSKGGYVYQYLNNWQISASLTKILGSHSLKLGTELRLMDSESNGILNAGTNAGAFAFGNKYTGDEWSDFLLGYTSGATLGLTNWTAAYNYYQAYYLQDNWQISKKLMLNLGVRYDLPGSLAERHDKATVLLPTAVDPNTGVKGTLALVNSPQYGSRTVTTPPMNKIAPRVSFAYRLGSDMSIRGGYGINYLAPDLALTGASQPNGSTVNSAQTTLVQLVTPADPSFVTMVNPFPNGLLQPVGRNTPNFMTTRLFNTAIAGAFPDEPFPYMQQWNLSISRQMKGDWMVEAGYAGSKATHLPAIGTGLDQLDKSWWNHVDAVTGKNDNATKDCVLSTSAPGGSTYTTTTTRGRCRQPYPYYSNFSKANASWGATNYNSLQVKVQKRFRSGGLLMGSYTWSKMLGDTDLAKSTLEAKASQADSSTGFGFVQDFNNHQAEHSLMSYNLPNRLVVSYVMPLPFGQGQRYLNSLNGFASRLVSGWALNGITTFQSGFALQIREAANNTLSQNYGTGTLRADVVAGCNKSVAGSTRERVASGKWFNTACWQAPGTSTNTVGWALGNSPRIDGAVQSEGVDNWDISFAKETKIWERAAIDFRGEFFNIFNRTQFAPPILQRGNAQFGQILSQGNKPRMVQFSLRVKF